MKELIELLKPVVEQVLFEQEVQEICTKAQTMNLALDGYAK